MAHVDPPEIGALEAAIVQAQLERWAFYAVPAEEIARLLPGVQQLAKNVCNGLRAEHAARTRR
jgi:hypothetical protein